AQTAHPGAPALAFKHAVGLATVIDQLRATAADRTIDAPVLAHPQQVASVFGALHPRAAARALAGVFNHADVRGNRFVGEHSEAMNSRGPHGQAIARQLLVDDDALAP